MLWNWLSGNRALRPAAPGVELRRTRRLIAACILALALAGAGLVVTVGDVAGWMDSTGGEIERQRVVKSLDTLNAARPDLTAAALAMRVARDLSLPDARVTPVEGRSGRDLSVPLSGEGAHLVWTAPTLGTAALRNFAPTRVPFILGVVGCVALLLIRVNRLATDLERERLAARELASRDALTGLGNRFAFEQAIAGRLREGRPFALFCLDLDGFKAVNDSLGHAAGDAVLRGVAARLARLLAADDAAFRIGGDEFALLLDSGDRNLQRLARKIALSLDETYRIGPDTIARIGVSIGVAQAPDEATSADALMMLADAALYQAKGETGSAFRFAVGRDTARNEAAQPELADIATAA